METLVERMQKDLKICENGPWMIPEPTQTPTGNEAGDVSVIGVGGSTLRLRHVTISKENCVSTNISTVPITDDVKTSDSFTWFGKQSIPAIEKWAAEHSTIPMPPLAISWSFPLSHGKIQSMGKSFGREFDGQDVLTSFNKVSSPQFRATSVTHDGTSSLVAGMHASPHCVMALTSGTGVNINLRHENDRLINTESSFLGRPDTTPHITLIKSPLFDINDHRSEFQPFETQVGGMYLCEMVSNILHEPVSTPDSWKILEDPEDRRYPAASAVVIRAASLVASAIYGSLMFSKPPNFTGTAKVVYTGGVIFEPQFRSRLDSLLHALSKKFQLEVESLPQEFGSEIGSAIAALSTVSTEQTL